jgi:hypothetical protein
VETSYQYHGNPKKKKRIYITLDAGPILLMIVLMRSMAVRKRLRSLVPIIPMSNVTICKILSVDFSCAILDCVVVGLYSTSCGGRILNFWALGLAQNNYLFIYFLSKNNYSIYYCNKLCKSFWIFFGKSYAHFKPLPWLLLEISDSTYIYHHHLHVQQFKYSFSTNY